MSTSKVIAVVGASGSLGKSIVKVLVNAGHSVRGIVRPQSIEKTKEAFGDISIDILSVENLDTAFNDVNTVIEVVSNTERPNGIRKFLEAAEKANVETFVACGGAFGLFLDDTKTNRAISVAGDNPNFVAMNDMHLKVQEMAFASTIPTVLQICPPYMNSAVEKTGNFEPNLNITKGVMQVHYDDAAAVLAEALKNPTDYNRGMMAIVPKK